MDKEAKQRSFEEAKRKLRDLARKSPTYDIFVGEMGRWRRWYQGDQIPPEMRMWTHKEFQQFYEENKG